MILFTKRKSIVRVPKPVPKECEGLDIRVEASVCTGEKTIGFYDPKTKNLLCSELVRNDEDIAAYYSKYGREPGDM